MAHSDRGHPSVRSPGPIVLICNKEKAGGVSPPRVPRGTPSLSTDEKEVRRRESDDTNSNVSVGPPDPGPPEGRLWRCLTLAPPFLNPPSLGTFHPPGGSLWLVPGLAALLLSEGCPSGSRSCLRALYVLWPMPSGSLCPVARAETSPSSTLQTVLLCILAVHIPPSVVMSEASRRHSGRCLNAPLQLR